MLGIAISVIPEHPILAGAQLCVPREAAAVVRRPNHAAASALLLAAFCRFLPLFVIFRLSVSPLRKKLSLI